MQKEHARKPNHKRVHTITTSKKMRPNTFVSMDGSEAMMRKFDEELVKYIKAGKQAKVLAKYRNTR